MLLHFFKSAWRNITRNKVFSIINILGLALGMASSLLIFLWIQDERKVGTEYDHAADLYRILENEYTAEKIVTDEDTPGLIAEELKKQFPEVVYASGFSWQEEHVLTVGDKTTRQWGRWAGNDWFKMYSIPLIAGVRNSVLDGPKSLAISEKMAIAYFKDPRQAIGKTIEFDNNSEFQVTAVFKDLPDNSPEKYSFLLNWDDFLGRNPWLRDWTNGGPGARIQLSAGTDPDKFNAKLKWFLKGRNTDFGPTFYISLFAQPETRAYLHANFKNGLPDGGRIQYVQLLGIVAVFLLLIAGINFMNLATARSVKRAREVGVRKAIGAGKGNLIRQFMGEALLLTSLALLVAILLVELMLPAFNQLTAKNLTFSLTSSREWILIGLLLVTMTILAGSYPALFLSSLRPVRVLKGVLRFGWGAKFFRKGLVVFQFMMSMLLIVGTVVIYRQLQYIQHKNLGYDRGNLIRITGEGELGAKYALFKQELLRMPGIEAVTHSSLNPMSNGSTTEGVEWPGKDPNVTISFNQAAIGYDFAKVLRLKMKDGRDFTPTFGMDSSNYLINEAAAKSIGYKDPVGKPLTFWRNPGMIVGLIEDFHFNSLHSPITPMIIRLNETINFQNIFIRVKPGQTPEALKSLKSLYTKINPKYPFEYSFVDTDYQYLYSSETVIGRLATMFAILSIFIACLGLLGLTAFTAEQRTKEIGVRKVLGASVSSIVRLLSKDFLRLVLVSIILATPIAWIAMNQWLQGFEYKIKIEWWFFLLAGILSIAIALLTISFQSIKAALVNPAKRLKTE